MISELQTVFLYIFFNSDIESNKLSSTITDKSVDELVSLGIIPAESLTLIKDYDESNVKLMYDIYHIDYLVFNGTVPPTSLVLNKEMFEDIISF